jgi:hypothetical protein
MFALKKLRLTAYRQETSTAVSHWIDSITHEAFSQKAHKIIANRSPGKGPRRDKAQQKVMYDLHSVGSQFSNITSTQHWTLLSSLAYTNQNHVCPYHNAILGDNPINTNSGRGLNPMTRYLAEGPSEQYATFQPDTGELSLRKGCLCTGNGNNLEINKGDVE